MTFSKLWPRLHNMRLPLPFRIKRRVAYPSQLGHVDSCTFDMRKCVAAWLALPWPAVVAETTRGYKGKEVPRPRMQ